MEPKSAEKRRKEHGISKANRTNKWYLFQWLRWNSLTWYHRAVALKNWWQSVQCARYLHSVGILFLTLESGRHKIQLQTIRLILLQLEITFPQGLGLLSRANESSRRGHKVFNFGPNNSYFGKFTPTNFSSLGGRTTTLLMIDTTANKQTGNISAGLPPRHNSCRQEVIATQPSNAPKRTLEEMNKIVNFICNLLLNSTLANSRQRCKQLRPLISQSLFWIEQPPIRTSSYTLIASRLNSG